MKHFSLTLLLMMSLVSCTNRNIEYRLVEPIPDGWDCSQWISAANAQVVEETITDGHRAADGASWFVFELGDVKDVKSVRWMTAGLGVYQLYVNGNVIGNEVLKPGFTHP